MMMMTA